jgi:predicted Zn-dependent protease
VALSLDDTIRMLEWAEDIDPSNVYVTFTLARLYTEAGQHEKARKLFKQITKNSQSASPEVQDALNQVKSRQAQDKHKRYRKYSKN